jgi:type II secretory pathway pseudopilin PulG
MRAWQDTTGRKVGTVGFSLVEMIIVVGLLALLVSILLPSLGAAKEGARRVQCQARQRNIGIALHQYAFAHDQHLPPFAFSDPVALNLPLSEHWGGLDQPADPQAFCPGAENVNLYCLAAEGLLKADELVCPSQAARPGAAGFFPYTRKYSSYCLRTPYSLDLFAGAPNLANWHNSGLLAVYAMAAGGQSGGFGALSWQKVPLASIQGEYAEINPRSGAQRTLDMASGALLCDNFYYRDYNQTPPPQPGLAAHPVQAKWNHAERFNVLFGDNSCRFAEDDNTLRGCSVTDSAGLADDGCNYASYALQAWWYLEKTAK